MARYVVLSFEDNDEAEAFVKETARVYVADERTSMREVFATVEAMMQKPTMFCDGLCREGNKRVQGYSRGTRYGWWVCMTCGKPPRKWAESLSAVLGCGVNLLRDRMSQQMEREEANMVIEDFRSQRRMDIGRYPDGGAR